MTAPSDPLKIPQWTIGRLAHRGGRLLLDDISAFRGIAARYEKTVTSYEAAVALASLLLWARRGRAAGAWSAPSRAFRLDQRRG